MAYPIIALWSHPRSMSTAIERIMRERGDLTCLHEPFLYDYYIARRVRYLPHFDPEPGRPISYEAIRADILAKAESGPVFFKDMSYYVIPRILEDEAFSRRLTNCFLIRNPFASISSYYALDSEVTSEEIGLVAEWTHFQAVAALLNEPPVILEAARVQADTNSSMAAFWKRVGLPYREEAFSWDSDAVPDDWVQVGGWHGKVAASGGIRAGKSDSRDRFRALLEEAPHLKGFLAEHQPAYEALLDMARGQG